MLPYGPIDAERDGEEQETDDQRMAHGGNSVGSAPKRQREKQTAHLFNQQRPTQHLLRSVGCEWSCFRPPVNERLAGAGRKFPQS
jgi:hypothetical protein